MMQTDCETLVCQVEIVYHWAKMDDAMLRWMAHAGTSMVGAFYKNHLLELQNDNQQG
jgi:hypothetical protein